MKTIISICLWSASFFIGTAKAQFEVNPPKWYPAVKYSNLYVYMSDTSKPHSKIIMNIIRENWKLCPVIFSLGKPVESLVIPGNLFLSVSSYTRTIQFIRENFAGQPGFSKGTTQQNDYYYLCFEAASNSGSSAKNELNVAARAELYLKTIGYGGQDQLERDFKKDLKSTGILRKKESSFDLADRDLKYVYLNGNPGNIKNMVQFVNNQLAKGQSCKLLDDLSPTAEMAKLKADTLYVPNYWYGEDGLTMESLEHDSKPYKITVKYTDEMVAAYPYKIKLIGRDELNDKILQANKDFYYYNYIQSSANKIVSVINGYTGDVIYREITRLKYRPNEKDFERLGNAVGK
ncbi:MAG TPA: hypothetical protein VK483_15040 [Chitinophagaceae bacterium]|nr:hypothetical protein [Chitinophagaceae bacterium]